MEDLLQVVLRESAEELHLGVHQAPTMVLGGKRRPLDAPAMTSDNVMLLFQSLATGDQLQELRVCGEIQFIYLLRESARFSVSARVQRETFDVKIKNLSR
jgi:Tfp pilus assembly ATPase PilU